MSTPIHVLLVEDVSDDAKLVLLELERGGFTSTWKRVETDQEMRAALQAERWDIILSDFNLPQFSAAGVLELARQLAPDVPVVVVSGAVGEQMAVETMRAGAADYVLKHNLVRLGSVVQRELQAAETRRQRKRAEESARREADERNRLVTVLGERVKELTALHRIARLLQDSTQEPAGLLQAVADHLCAAMQHVDIAAARITFAGQEVRTTGFRSTAWRLVAGFTAGGQEGQLEVVYLEERPAGNEGLFFAEERNLLNSVAEMFRGHFNRRRAEEELRDREARFRAIIEKSFDAVVLCSASGRLVYASPASAQILGCGPQELIGCDGFTLIHPDDLSAIRQRWDDLLRTPGGLMTSTHRAGCNGLDWRWVETRCTNLLDDPAVSAVVINFRDVTEQRESSEQLLRSEQESAGHLALLETLLGNAPVGFAFIDREFRYVRVNEALAVMNGVSRDEMFGRTVAEVVPHFWAEVEPIYRGLLAGGSPSINQEVSAELGGSPGQVRHFLVSRYPVHIDGQIIGIGIVVNDISEQKRTEAALRQLASIVSGSDDAIIGETLDGVITSWNPGAERLYGYRAEEVVGKSIALLIPPDRVDELQAILQRVGRGERHETFEAVRLRKNGSPVEVSVTVSPIVDAVGRVVGASAIARDISDQKRAQADLRASEERLRLAAEAASFGMFDHDFATGQTFRSAEFKAIFGLAPDAPFEMADDGLPLYIHPADRAEVLARIQSVVDPDGPGVDEIQHRIVRADDGSTRWVLIRGRTIFAGTGKARRPVRFTGIMLDLTERLRAEAVLNLRDRAIQAVASGIIITDPSQPDNPIIYTSPGFTRLTGYPPDEVLGKNCRFLQGKDTDRNAVEEIRSAVHAGCSCDVELINYRKDGSPFWNRLLVSPVRDDAGLLTHFVGVQTDITERRSLEEQFRQAQKMEAIGRLAGGVAHDFNNLLTVINGYGEIVADSLPADHPAKRLVREIRNAGERAAGLTRQLLAFSRKTVLEPKVLDMNTQVRDMATLLRRLIGEDIQLAISLDPDLGRVKADPGQLEQAVVNLCVNARDAMPQGGKITLETHNVELGTAYAREHADVQPGEYVLLAVTDSGQGMDAATKVRIFEPFFTTKELGRGTGLGLSMVYGFVKQSMGHVAVYSELGKGAAFKLYLPRARETISTGKSNPGLSQMPPGNETLLLVEDEDGVRALGRHILQACGYNVLEAGDGREAVRVAERYILWPFRTCHYLRIETKVGDLASEKVGAVGEDCRQLWFSAAA